MKKNLTNIFNEIARRRRGPIKAFATIIFVLAILVVLVALGLLIWILIQRIRAREDEENNEDVYSATRSSHAVYQGDKASEQILSSAPTDIAAEAFQDDPSYAQSNSAFAHQGYRNPLVAEEQERLLYEQQQNMAQESERIMNQQAMQQNYNDTQEQMNQMNNM